MVYSFWLLLCNCHRTLADWLNSLTTTHNLGKFWFPYFAHYRTTDSVTWSNPTSLSKNLPSIASCFLFELSFVLLRRIRMLRRMIWLIRIWVNNGGLGSAFLQEFRNWESAWALDALYVIAYEIRVLAERVKNEKLYPCIILLLSGFFKMPYVQESLLYFLFIQGWQRVGFDGENPGEIEGCRLFPHESVWGSCCMSLCLSLFLLAVFHVFAYQKS